MSQSLLEYLIKDKKIQINTMITLERKFKVNHFNNIVKEDEFFITSIGYNKDRVLTFKGKSKTSQFLEKTFKWTDILEIEGMTLERLAENYNLDLEGNPLPVKLDELGEPLRRGRKTKLYYEKLKELKGSLVDETQMEEESLDID